jgi:hypothetical protein
MIKWTVSNPQAFPRLAQNTFRMNGVAGVAVDDATIELRDNAVVSNGGGRDSDGIAVLNGALDSDASIEISNNDGAGIWLEDNGSEATIDSRNIIFSNNAEGDVVGNVIDMPPEP